MNVRKVGIKISTGTIERGERKRKPLAEVSKLR